MPTNCKDENKITAAQLVSEITPLIKECFICKTTGNGHAIEMTFVNGQKFLLIVKEVHM